MTPPSGVLSVETMVRRIFFGFTNVFVFGFTRTATKMIVKR